MPTNPDVPMSREERSELVVLLWKLNYLPAHPQTPCCEEDTYCTDKKTCPNREIITQVLDLLDQARVEGYEEGRKSAQEHQHNWLVKDEHSGWLSRPGGRELKTVYCSTCLKERNI